MTPIFQAMHGICVVRKFGMKLQICMLVFDEGDVVSECMVDQQGLQLDGVIL